MKKRRNNTRGELRPNYDLRQLLKGAARGKYAKRHHAGTNLVLLDPDVRERLFSERAVNEALRAKSVGDRAGTQPRMAVLHGLLEAEDMPPR